ncbi:hypothetical protein EZ444_07255 [Pedobacter hiemivivus]|uniref:Uncharacterized protein n=1 Tax=Pedobacter hiemivivus TaxID=2530454 RepID=A0A4R0NBX5_9SPHI|nr:hypothetical protein EZ444_07255 [Pedobacter hiemivivus]
MIKDILRFSLLLALTNLGLKSYGQKPTPSDTLKNKIQTHNYRKLVHKDSTRIEKIDRLNSDYRELIVAAMTNTKLGEAERRTKIDQLIAEKTKKLKELQTDKENTINVRSLRRTRF